jgi:hypothetical protein
MPLNRDTWQHQGVPRGMMTSSGGSGVLTSAVGLLTSALTGQHWPVNGQRSRWGQRSTGPTGQPHPEADRWAPRVRPEQEEKTRAVSGPKVVTGRLKAQWLGLSSQGQLGLRLSRPARAAGLAGREGWLGSDPSRAGFPSSVGRTPFFSSARLGCLTPPPRGPAASFSFSSLTGRAQVSVTAGSGAAGLDLVRQKVCVCACGRRGARAGVDARRALGEMPQRHGRDANATSRSRRGGGRARQGRGAGKARLGCGQVACPGRARTRAGPGVPGPRRGRAVREAPASRARGTTRWRWGDGGSGGKQRRVGLLHKKDGTAAGGERVVPRVFYRGLLCNAGSSGGKNRNGGNRAHRRGWRRGVLKQRRGEAGGSKPCRASSSVDEDDRGAGSVKTLRRGGGVLLLGHSSCSLSLGCGDGGKGIGVRLARVLGCGRRVLMRGAGLLGVRAGTCGGIVARGERG